MRRITLVPVAALAGLALAAVSSPALAAASPTPPAVHASSRNITAIAQAERAAHSSKLRPFATSGSYAPMRDVYPVGQTLGATVDAARGTAARSPNPASKTRFLPITIWYPAVSGAISSSDTFWAKARTGKFPLVVFAPGFNSNPQTYQVFLHAIAAQGYIVAAPTFPIEASITGMAPASRSNTEIINQMYDMSAVITQMIAYAKTPGNFLGWAMNPTQIGVIGHSDGAMTVAGMTMSTSYADNRIKTAVVMSGAGPTGLAWGGRKVVPLLMEQPSQDPYNDPAGAAWIFNHVTGARSYLTVFGPYHIWPLIGNDETADLTRRTIVAHLDGQLKAGGIASFWQMVTTGNTAGYTSMRFAN